MTNSSTTALIEQLFCLTRSALLLVRSIMIVLLCASAARAEITNWVGGSFDYHDRANWSNGVPTADSIVTINSVVVLSKGEIATANTLQMGSEAGITQLGLNDGIGILGGGLIAGIAPGSLAVISTGLASSSDPNTLAQMVIRRLQLGVEGSGQFFINHPQIGANQRASLGLLGGVQLGLTSSGNGGLYLTNSTGVGVNEVGVDNFILGEAGTGIVTIPSRTAMYVAPILRTGTTDFRVGLEEGSSGTITVSGGVLDVRYADMDIGVRGSGNLNVSNGGQVLLPWEVQVQVGSAAGGVGRILLEGGSINNPTQLITEDFFFRRPFKIGVDGGHGELIVREDGAEAILIDLFMAASEGIEGSALLDISANGLVIVDTLESGTNGASEIRLASGGLLQINNSMVLGSESTLTFELGGLDDFGTMNPEIGSVELGGTFRLELGSGFQPQEGDAWQLWSLGDITGSFSAYDLSAAMLGPQLFWDLSQLESDGLITVVPEPSAVLLLLACGMLYFLNRRQRQG